MNLLPLTNDLVFKSVFVKNPKLLISLINAVLFPNSDKRIIDLEILNPDIPTSFSDEKQSILDIRAKDSLGNIFHVEMQVGHQSVFVKRSLVYLGALIRDQLSPSEPYSNLKPIYQINILDFKLIPSQNFINRFKFREETDRDLTLTDDLEIIFIELRKFNESSKKISSALEAWIYFIKNAHTLTEVDMDIVVDKLPDLKYAYQALELYSSDPVQRKRLEDKINSDRDFAYEVAFNFEKGLREGELKGKTEGKVEGKIETAKSLLAKGFSVVDILDITALSPEDLKRHGVV